MCFTRAPATLACSMQPGWFGLVRGWRLSMMKMGGPPGMKNVFLSMNLDHGMGPGKGEGQCEELGGSSAHGEQ